MPSVLPFTGERFTPECAGGIWYEHWHRYVLIRDWVAGKVVVDAACGEGYGSAFLAECAAHVTGLDVSAEAIDHARQTYAARANLEYVTASVTSIPLADASVDVVVSFETIEHLVEQEAMLDEFRRILKADGILLLSAPNRPVYSDAQNYRNEYHVREHDRAELQALLAPRFSQTRWFGQRLQFNSVIWTLDEPPGRYAQANSTAMDSARLQPAGWTPDAMYFLVICAGAAAALPDGQGLSLFADANSSVLKQYEQLMGWQWTAREQIAQLEAEAAKWAERSAEEARSLKAREDTCAALQAEVARLSALLAESETTAHALRAEVQLVSGQLAHRNSLIGWMRWPFHRIRKLLGA